ncbi:MAG: CYTH domain-containing protein [Microbacterium pygmaeum]
MAAGADSSRSVEVERKFDADDGTPLPDWSALPGVARTDAAEIRELDAAYLDTVELHLARAGYALRRRTGGPDEGWHLKGPRVGDGRVELGWPLGEKDRVPEGALAEIAAVTDAVLAPIARIENLRTAYALRSADGTLVAEFVDDRVRATDARSGIVRTWREWEVELGPAGPAAADRAAFFHAVEAAVLSAGGRPAASDSKLARALGY